MKKLFRILFAVVIALTSVSMVSSCSGIFDPDNYETGWTESGNKIVYKMGLGIYSYVLTFEFHNDVCVKATEEYIFSSAELARAFWDELDEEERSYYHFSGKTVSADVTEEYAGMTRDEIKEIMDYMDDYVDY